MLTLTQRLVGCVILLVALGLFPAAAQKPSVIPLLPAANWRLVSSQQADLGAVRKWRGDPAIEREYGVKSVTERTYELDHRSAQVLLEEAADPATAYGLLTLYQTENMRPEKEMLMTVTGSDGALMARGSYLIRVARPAGDYPLSNSDFRALLILIGGTRSAWAGLPVPLPSEGLVAGSEKYLLGPEAARHVLPSFRIDLLGFDKGAEAEVANYATDHSGKSRATLILVYYPTPNIARTLYAAMQEPLKLNQDQGTASTSARRQGSFVMIVLNSRSQTAANRLLHEFSISQQVSWDQPPPSRKPIYWQVAELILANMVFVLTLVGLTVVGGVMVFSAKLLKAKWLAHSGLTNVEDGEFIRLNLT